MALGEILAALIDTDLDSVLEGLIARAIDAVQLELDWYFCAPRSTEEILDGTGNRALWLRQPPVGDVVVSSRTTVGGSWSVVVATEYELGGGGLMVGRGLFNVGNWTLGFRNYRVAYDEGFEVMPGDIEQLLIDIVSAKWKGRNTNPAMKSEKIGDYSYTRGDLEDSARWGAVVARWRRGRI